MSVGLWKGAVVESLRGSELAARREAAGYSRETFAQRVGISRRTLETWERDSGPGVPKGKRHLVELVLTQPPEQMTTLSLIALLAARLSAGEAASERLAQVEREHPDWFDNITADDGSDPATDNGGATVSSSNDEPTTLGKGVARGTRGRAPRRRIIKGDEDADG